MSVTTPIALLSLLFALTSCAQDDKPKEKNRKDKDRGELTMLLNGVEWQAFSARARIRENILKISGSKSEGSYETKVVRQSLELSIRDYAGPGTYEASMTPMGSSIFLVVGLNTQSETEMEKEVLESLTKAKHMLLTGAEIVIESDNGKEIRGTFSFKRGDSSIKDGKFRAIIKANKPKD